MKKTWLFVLLTLFFIGGCGNEKDTAESNEPKTSEKEALEKVTVVLDWTPNTNHTGLYTAQENVTSKRKG